MSGVRVELPIRMTHTDAAGIAYFASFLDLAHQAYETAMEAVGVPLPQDLRAVPVMLPIVHAECDYEAPLRLGDRVSVEVTVTRIGKTSFSIGYTFTRQDDVRCGRGGTVHACVSNETQQSVPLPDELRTALGAIGTS